MNAGWRGPSRLWNCHCLQQTGSQTSMYPTSHLKSASDTHPSDIYRMKKKNEEEKKMKKKLLLIMTIGYFSHNKKQTN